MNELVLLEEYEFIYLEMSNNGVFSFDNAYLVVSACSETMQSSLIFKQVLNQTETILKRYSL